MAARDAFQKVLAANSEWAAKVAQSDTSFFANSAKGQAPKVLWIGCADSRVPETTILGCQPGDVFTHRNIANILTPSDLSSLAVIEYAVAHLKVEHAVVCGHTSCGGVAASLANSKLGILDPWLQPIRALRMKHTDELAALEGAEKTRRLSELNVLGSLQALKQNATVIEAVKSRGLMVHGVIYDLASGKLETVSETETEAEAKKRIEAFNLSSA
ncbi:hypothetical protein MBLNU457_6783t1 [Dothideomycetes sp. NU457]